MPSQIKFSQDEKFLHSLNQGSETAFLKLYDALAPKIFRYIYYKVGRDKALAEELAQQTFFKAWEYIATRETEIKNAQAFLYRIAHNLVVDQWRGKERASLPLLDELIETTEASPRWLEEIDARVDTKQLEGALEKIPEQYKNIILMRYLDELEIEEISQALGKDKNNVYVLIHRALKSIRQVIEVKHKN